ncbi:serine hydrolase domain-containing protein [Solimonas sp. K1W22B-7]|uniref:serine hydrolase domain-containing protein n=1 Tax=Solimonas sp. K1W22B-7 TaxID=2303331 RepID=UPI0019695DC3|nr:serine hydrolase domain-containing protein [Solimonas sp. K1W22B-7]
MPRDLGQARSIDAASERPAAAAGLSDAAVQAIWTAVEDLYRTGAYPAVTFCLRRNGQVVLNRALGHARGNGPGEGTRVPQLRATPDTPISLFSASKAVTAALLHLLAEEGGVDLDRPVVDYLPAFGAHGKHRITLADVLAHRGGIPSFRLPQAQRRIDLLADWEQTVALLCAATPSTQGRQAYHAMTGGYILGEVLQRVTGRPIREYLDRRLRHPLGMKHFTYGLPREHRDRVAHNYAAGAPVRFPVAGLVQRQLIVPFDEIIAFSNTDRAMDAVVPSGNLFATAEELSRFYQMLLDGGRHEGRQVMQPATVARLIRPVGRAAFDHTVKLPIRYSEGLILGGNPFGLYGPMTGRAYGHLGFMNIFGWADPDRHIACSLLVTGKAILGTHLLALGRVLNSIARQCRPLRAAA